MIWDILTLLWRHSSNNKPCTWHWCILHFGSVYDDWPASECNRHSGESDMKRYIDRYTKNCHRFLSCYCSIYLWPRTNMIWMAWISSMRISIRVVNNGVTTQMVMKIVRMKMATRAPFYKHGLTLITVWVSNYTHCKVWDEITYPYLNFNDCTVISHFTRHVITYQCWD